MGRGWWAVWAVLPIMSCASGSTRPPPVTTILDGRPIATIQAPRPCRDDGSSCTFVVLIGDTYWYATLQPLRPEATTGPLMAVGVPGGPPFTEARWINGFDSVTQSIALKGIDGVWTWAFYTPLSAIHNPPLPGHEAQEAQLSNAYCAIALLPSPGCDANGDELHGTA
jgi:hypothetical protein